MLALDGDDARRSSSALRLWLRWACGPLLLVGCGDGIAIPDASHSTDADRLQPVWVFVAPSETSSGSATVYFQNHDSSIALATRTDGAGKANGFMEPNGFVTVVETIGGIVSIYTYAGVSPGDKLYVHPEVRVPAPLLTVRASPAPPDTTFELRTACSTQFSGSETTQMSLVGCTVATDVMVLPSASTYAFANDVQLGAASLVEMPSYRAFEASTFTVTHVQNDASLTIDHAFAISSRVFSTGAETTQAIGGVAELTRSLPLAEGGITRSSIDPQRDDWPRVIAWRPAGAMATMDYAPSDWPSAAEARFNTGDMTITWNEAPKASTPRASYAALQWSGARQYRWQIVALRGSDPSVLLPTLPDVALMPPADALLVIAPLHLAGGAELGLPRILGSWEPSRTTGWPIVGDQGTVVWRVLMGT